LVRIEKKSLRAAETAGETAVESQLAAVLRCHLSRARIPTRAGEPAEASKVDKKPKRNSKDDLTKKILQVVEKYRIDFEYSDTKLRRMSKTELQKLLATVMEQCVKIDMAGGPSE